MWSARASDGGDEAVHAKAGEDLWRRAQEALTAHFRERRYAEGIEACVRAVGAELAALYPKAEGPGGNRLSDDISGV